MRTLLLLLYLLLPLLAMPLLAMPLLATPLLTMTLLTMPLLTITLLAVDSTCCCLYLLRLLLAMTLLSMPLLTVTLLAMTPLTMPLPTIPLLTIITLLALPRWSTARYPSTYHHHSTYYLLGGQLLAVLPDALAQCHARQQVQDARRRALLPPPTHLLYTYIPYTKGSSNLHTNTKGASLPSTHVLYVQVLSFNLGGMGCSASVISVDLVRP